MWRILHFVIAMSMSLSVWAANDGVVTKDFFQDKADWVVLEMADDGGLRVYSGPAVLFRKDSIFCLYTEARLFCVFYEGKSDKVKLKPSSGFRFRNQEVNGLGGYPGEGQSRSLPRPLEAQSNEFLLSLERGENADELTVPVKLYRGSVDEDPTFPVLRMEYSLDPESQDVQSIVFDQDTVTIDVAQVSLKRLIVPAVDIPLRIESIDLRNQSGSVFSRSFPEEGVLGKEEVLEINNLKPKDVSQLSLLITYCYPKKDYKWEKVTKTYCIVFPEERPDPFRLLSLLAKVLAGLLLLLSLFLIWQYGKNKAQPSDSSDGSRRYQDALDGLKRSVEENEQKIQWLESQVADLQEGRKGLLFEISQRDSAMRDAQTRFSNREKELLDARQADKDAYEHDLDELKRKTDRYMDDLKQLLRKDRECYLSRQFERIDRIRQALAAMSGTVVGDSVWADVVQEMNTSFSRLSEKMQAFKEPSLLQESGSIAPLQAAMREVSLPFLKNRKSWVNHIVRFHSYYQNGQLRQEMASNGLYFQDIADLYSGMQEYLLGCGISLTKPPRLFIDTPDEGCQVHNMDIMISWLYPAYGSLVGSSAVVDILQTGFSMEDGSVERTIVATYSKPQA